MKVTITSITLRNPLKFFLLSLWALKITRQLQGSPCRSFRKQGFWMRHYTMTLWDNEQDLKSFANSDSHRKAMAKTAKIAREVRVYTMEADELPDWKTARKLLETGKRLTYR